MQALARILLFGLPGIAIYSLEFWWANSFDFWSLSVPEMVTQGILLTFVNLILPVILWKCFWRRRFPESTQWLFWMVTVLLATSPWRHARGPDGDVPHQLMGSYSILKDGDLLLENNYSNSAHQYFYYDRSGGWAMPDTRTTQDTRGAQRLWYLPGVAFINAPLAIFPRSFLINLFLAVSIAVGLSAIWFMTSGSGLLKAIAMLTTPIFAYSVQAFPDPYGFALVSLFLYDANSPKSSFRALFWLALLVWLKPAFFTVSCLLTFYFLMRSIEQGGRNGFLRASLGLPILLLSILSLMIFNYYAWGRFNLIGAHPGLAQAGFSLVNLIDQLPLFFFGIAGGAFLFSPILLFFLWQPFKIKTWSGLILLCICVTYIVFLGCFPWSEGGWSPRGRYLLVILPIMLQAINYDRIVLEFQSKMALAISSFAFLVVCIYPDTEMPWNSLGYPLSILTTEKFWPDYSSRHESLRFFVELLSSNKRQIAISQGIFVGCALLLLLRAREGGWKNSLKQIKTAYRPVVFRKESKN